MLEDNQVSVKVQIQQSLILHCNKILSLCSFILFLQFDKLNTVRRGGQFA